MQSNEVPVKWSFDLQLNVEFLQSRYFRSFSTQRPVYAMENTIFLLRDRIA